MTSVDASLAPALERLRSGDVHGARRAAEAALSRGPDQPALREFAGIMAARTGDAPGAIEHFRQWMTLSPGDEAARFNLATALTSAGNLDEAAKLCSNGQVTPRLQRLAGYIYQQLGRLEEAAQAYRTAAEANPDDFESWNNLGNVRFAQNDLDGAIEALDRARLLRPDVLPIYSNLSEVLARADRREARQTLMRDAASRAPTNADVLAELGLAEAGAGDLAAAQDAFRAALALDPSLLIAYVELGVLLENMNKVEELRALIADAEANGVSDPELSFLKAWALRRAGRFEEALPLAEALPSTINPIRRAQLIAEISDRTGDPNRAFKAFGEMNAASLAAAPVLNGPTYRELVAADAGLLTPERVRKWTSVKVKSDPAAPVFIVGFPRSGTTLLDTLLMNLPQLHVLEERPVLREVQEALGDARRLGKIDSAEANALRRRYFDALGQMQPPTPGATVVDKFPLHMAEMPLIHRIFPDAKVIFVERHPYDAVLSCFMANFQLNAAMRSFTDLEEAALTYDAVFDAWTRATSLLPIAVHRVRYERMVTNLEDEMRPLLEFLELPWDPRVLDNQASAAKREHIRTASYSQVTERIYRRAIARWERYREQMQPVIPILRPWAERMGYEI